MPFADFVKITLPINHPVNPNRPKVLKSKKTNDFAVGDRVRVVSGCEYNRRLYIGLVGTIVIPYGLDGYEVEFPGWTYGHEGTSEDGAVRNRWNFAHEGNGTIELC